jgi:hypothetical protein
VGWKSSHLLKSVSACPGGLTTLLKGPKRPALIRPCAHAVQQEGSRSFMHS